MASKQPTAQVQAELKPPTVDELLKLVNEERAKVGVKPLRMNENVRTSAQLKVDDLVNRNYFAHNIKGTNYTVTPEMDRLLDIQCVNSSENLFWAKLDKTQTAVNGWLNSKPHRDAMLSDAYESIDIGTNDWRVVAHFCDEG